MDCRTTLLMAMAFSLCASGCLHPEKPPATPAAEVPVSRSGPEQACTALVALATLKESQAQDAGLTDEQQVRLRDEARQAYKEAVRLEPTNLVALRGLARINTQTGNYDLALETYKKALAVYPKNADLWTDRGQYHNRRKEWNEAVKCYEKALECGGDNRTVLMRLGVTLVQAGQTERALVCLTRASSLEMAHYYLARTFLYLNQPEPARRHLAEALRINPNLSNAREWLASLSTGDSDIRLVAGHGRE
jgi:tetratricopeptide (TPR) repeat protein